jgi:hypothetical protein
MGKSKWGSNVSIVIYKIQANHDAMMLWITYWKNINSIDILNLNMRVWGFFIILLTSFIISGTADSGSGQFKNMTEVNIFTTHEPHGAEFFKDYLFIADGNSLLIYNTSDPERPRSVNKFMDFNEPGRVLGLSVSGEQLYIAAGVGWVSVLNISDPENPKKMYQINNLNVANDIAVTDGYMYIADANVGMLIFDLSNPRNPELAGMFYVLKSNMSGSLQGYGGKAVGVSGNYAFLSGEERKGFYIIDVSNVTRPVEMSHSIGKIVYDMAIADDGVYLARANGTTQFDSLNISNPRLPQIVDTFSIAESADRSAIAIHPSGEYIYAASGNTWHIFRIPDILPPELVIERPGNDEIFEDQTINVSGSAFDKSGIQEILVNGKFAGNESWSRIIDLVEGINNITISAIDKKGNNITERIQVIYSPLATPVATSVIITPLQSVDTTPASTQTDEVEKTAVFTMYISVLFVLLALIASIVLIYWVWKFKIKRGL